MVSNQFAYRLKMVACTFVFFLCAAGSHADDSKKVLILNSNAGIVKYKTVEDEFKKSIIFPVMEIDLAGKEASRAQLSQARDYNPELIYCIGSGAYTLAMEEFKNKDIIFSSIINWLRLPISENIYGISNELHTRMTLMMYRYLFPGIQKIGVLYSRQYTLQWYEKVREEAAELGIQIIGKLVENKNETLKNLKWLCDEVDAVWLIPDPLVMPEKSYLYDILKTADKKKIPVFSYHQAFAGFGASLIVSVDNPTIGRQAAGIATALLTGNPPEDPVQFPAGSHITLNMKTIEKYGLKYNKNALNAVNNILK